MSAIDENNAASGNKAHSIVIWCCVACTAALAAAFVLFANHYYKNQDAIEARVVLLKGVTPPADSVPLNEVREWIKRYSEAMPGCLCTLGRTKSGEDDSALFLCIGFSEARGAAPVCKMNPDKLPEGVSMTVSPHSDLSPGQKMLFLLDRLSSKGLVSPRTESIVRK